MSGARHRPEVHRPDLHRPLALGLLATVAALVLSACGSTHQTAVTKAAASGAAASAETFLHSYVASDGRVIRRDQGGDTVSEGQAYAMLLDVAVGDRAQFTSVWEWSQHNLLQADGLLAYHWADGHVLDTNPASDADLDVAKALILAGVAWHDKAWRSEGIAYAAAILDEETVSVAGTTWLVAGPWARTAPYEIDPSYADPATFELLRRATGEPKWAQIETSSATVMTEDTDGGTRLPSDWAQLSGSGQVQPAGAPGGGAVLYSYDAFRVLIRQDDDCQDGTGRGLTAQLLPLAVRTASPSDRADSYNQDGTPSQSGDNPLMLIAAAGAEDAAGNDAARNAYLAAAADAAASAPSYYLEAWVALGRYLLTTSQLTGCSA